VTVRDGFVKGWAKYNALIDDEDVGEESRRAIQSAMQTTVKSSVLRVL
jgi:hypothetical protein